MTKPAIVTGCGRSGTHWLAHILSAVLGPEFAAHEPPDYQQVRSVVVDVRLREFAKGLHENGHRVVHLVRDGRDVVRSLDKWYMANDWTRHTDGRVAQSTDGGRVPFKECCQEWRSAIETMDGFPALRLEDLSTPRDAQQGFGLPHWRDWDEETTAMFWDICGDAMERMGYT